MLNATSSNRHFAPTSSIYPHTTLANVQLPVDLFMKRGESTYSPASVYDTPGFDGDQAYLQSFIDVEYERAVSLIKVGGFQRPADNMRPGSLVPPKSPSCRYSTFMGGLTDRTIVSSGRLNSHRSLRMRTPPQRTRQQSHPHHLLHKSTRTHNLPRQSLPHFR